MARAIEENAPLAPLTTMRLGGPAKRLVTAETETDLVRASREAALVIGGGSNLVIGDAGVDGTVVRIATRGIERKKGHFVVAAGEVWDDFVARVVADGYAGVECLAGIPGLVGATPMQNVGAYGQDVSETIVAVRAWDREADREVTFDRDACRFAYRSSLFRGSTRWIILEVTFALRATPKPVRYAELEKALGVVEAPATKIRETVIALRRKKGMVLDPSDPDTTSAGSFFTNPLVAPSLVPAGAPAFPEPDGRVKVSAGWLIEHAGFTKGFRKGRAGISSKHALALVNHGGTTRELLALAREVRAGVEARFGIRLENEPVLVGETL